MRTQRQHGTMIQNKKTRRTCLFFFLGILLIGFLIGFIVLFSMDRNPVSSNVPNDSKDQLLNKTQDASALQESSRMEETQEVDTSQTMPMETTETEETQNLVIEKEQIEWNEEWTYASFSEIHEDGVVLYHSTGDEPKNIVIAVNAGHGTPGGDSARTLCHPDGSPKVTGGSTAAGETYATAISSGMTFLDGTEESEATLSLAEMLKEKLLAVGYDVLMIRETNDCQIDNVGRTVYANEYADCHIALHYDSTEEDKGFFYISVPEEESYREMEPVVSHWEEHLALGEAILSGVASEGVTIFQEGKMALDLTQTSYATIPSVDLEVGDKASDISAQAQGQVADGIVRGIDDYFNA